MNTTHHFNVLCVIGFILFSKPHCKKGPAGIVTPTYPRKTAAQMVASAWPEVAISSVKMNTLSPNQVPLAVCPWPRGDGDGSDKVVSFVKAEKQTVDGHEGKTSYEGKDGSPVHVETAFQSLNSIESR